MYSKEILRVIAIVASFHKQNTCIFYRYIENIVTLVIELLILEALFLISRIQRAY